MNKTIFFFTGKIIDRAKVSKFIQEAPEGGKNLQTNLQFLISFFFHFQKKKKEDRNVFAVNEENNVCDVYRGLVDEVQNQLLHTTPLHKQQFNLPFSKPIPRIVPAKCLSSVRHILVVLRKYQAYRDQIVKTLQKNDFLAMFSVFSEMKFSNFATQTSTTTLEIEKDDLKVVVFHLTQTLALINGKQLFTKKELCAQFPECEPFIYRKEIDSKSAIKILQNLCDKLVSEMKRVQIRKKGDFQSLWLDPLIVAQNHFEMQSFGTVIDFKREGVRLHFYGISNPNSNVSKCDWPPIPEASQKILNHYETMKIESLVLFGYCFDAKTMLFSQGGSMDGVSIEIQKKLKKELKSMKDFATNYITLLMNDTQETKIESIIVRKALSLEIIE